MDLEPFNLTWADEPIDSSLLDKYPSLLTESAPLTQEQLSKFYKLHPPKVPSYIDAFPEETIS